MKNIILKNIPGHENRYKASDTGEIYSCLTNKFLSKAVHKNTGYELVNLTLKNTKQKVFYVHRLVAFAFMGYAKEGIQVNHKNGIKTDNRISNLEYMTHEQNQRHSWQVLKRKPSINYGEAAGSAKLTERDVLEMRRIYATGKYTYKRLGKKFGISGGHAAKIINKEAWAHL
jgi:hypothetical protein